jgi:hypothetical protein
MLTDNKIIRVEPDHRVLKRLQRVGTNVVLAGRLFAISVVRRLLAGSEAVRFAVRLANRDLGLKRMVKIKMYLPSKAEQRRFVKATGVLRKIRSQFEQFSTLGLDVFSTIQHRAFSNQL